MLVIIFDLNKILMSFTRVYSSNLFFYWLIYCSVNRSIFSTMNKKPLLLILFYDVDTYIDIIDSLSLSKPLLWIPWYAALLSFVEVVGEFFNGLTLSFSFRQNQWNRTCSTIDNEGSVQLGLASLMTVQRNESFPTLLFVTRT